MLLLSKISKIVPYSQEWFNHRLGVMTGSMVSPICAPEGIGVGAMTYIRNKVYEKITGKSTEKNITTDGTVWGIENEPIAIQEWKNEQGFYDIITDKHIIFNDRYSVTPDGLVIRDVKTAYIKDGTELNCETVESKSFMTPSVHMAHVECKTPEEIRRLNPKLFWQVVSQVYWADVLRGHAIFFHPDFKKGHPYRMGHVQFRRIEMTKEFNLFKTRTEEAERIFEQKLNFNKTKEEVINS